MLSVQETKWRGSKARMIGGGCTLYYHEVNGRENGVGVVVQEKYIKSVVEVESV